jgi:hypothetical protein
MLPLSRRNHPRYPVQKIVSYRYEDQSVLTLTLDLGLGGMKIKTLDSLPKDECLKFKLVLGANSIWPKGTIVYSRLLADQQVVSGVQFMEVSEDDHILLRKYLASLEEWPKPQGMVSSGEREDAGGHSGKTA